MEASAGESLLSKSGEHHVSSTSPEVSDASDATADLSAKLFGAERSSEPAFIRGGIPQADGSKV